MTYFIDPYKKYYSILSSGSNSSSNISSVSDKLSSAQTTISSVDSTLASSSWQELGITELSSSIIPNLKKNLSSFSSNYDKLSQMTSKAFGELLPETIKLKEADDKYDETVEKLSQLVSVSQYNSDGSVNEGYQTYVNTKADLEEKKIEYQTKCEEYIRNCNAIYNSIKSIDSSAEEFSVSMNVAASGSKLKTGGSIIESVEGGKMLKITYNGNEYYVVNSSINCLDYEKYVQKNGLYQGNGLLGGQCMVLSQYYAMDMMRGTWTSYSQMSSGSGSPATRISDYVKSTNEEDVLKYVYEEALAGRPTVLQVSQVNSYKGERHLVTVVGFDSSVKSYKDLTADKIFVLDCVDGKLQTLSQSRSEGGHERYVYAQAGNYLVRGASSAFKSEEVYNSNWQSKHGRGKSTTA